MSRICPRCRAENFDDATQCGQCRLAFVESSSGDTMPVAERLRRGRELLAQSRYDQAIVQLLRATATAPDEIEAHRLLARAYQAKGASQYALRAREAAVRADPKDGLAHYELGEAYREAGRAEEAVAQFNMALAIDPALQQAREAYQELEAVRDQALEEARAQAPPKQDAAAPEPGPMIIARRRHLLEAGNGVAVLVAIGLAFAGAFAVGMLFRQTTSPELVDRAPVFEAFIRRWVVVLAVVVGLFGAISYHHKVPLVGVVAGAFGGWAALTVAASMAKLDVPLQLLYTWVLASAGIAAGVEILAKVTGLSDRRSFLAAACTLSLMGAVAYSVLNQGRVHGYVRHHVTQEDILYDRPLADVEVVLVAVDNEGEVYTTKTRAASGLNQDFEWVGSFAFDHVPLKEYELRIRNPFDGAWVSQRVASEFAITQGTRYDVYLYPRSQSASKGLRKPLTKG